MNCTFTIGFYQLFKTRPGTEALLQYNQNEEEDYGAKDSLWLDNQKQPPCSLYICICIALACYFKAGQADFGGRKRVAITTRMTQMLLILGSIIVDVVIRMDKICAF